MLFNTLEFAVFFALVFALYHSMGWRAQNVLLLAASYVFYSWWDWRFLSLILISTTVDYYAANRMGGLPQPGRKKWLILSLVTNLGILGFFKYFNFFVDSFAGILQSIGIPAHTPTLSIVLPVGISFYTFQTMAYTIDVYRGRVPPIRDPIVFGVYVAFFPQLVAGPIERAQHLLPQFSRPRRVDGDMLSSGALLILIGLVRKVAIADFVAPHVDHVFANPGGMSTAQLLSGILLFAVQIYGDFAGYSDIAIGTARMMGIELMQNFRHPYFATNITVFWRRWHISLSTWLRDYLYIPLGGNRGPTWFVYRNLMLTMLLGGLWHGAAWTFVAWGGIHGLALVVHKLYIRDRDVPDRPTIASAWDAAKAGGSWLVTMLVVGLAWTFFRAPDFGTAWGVLTGIVSLRGGIDWVWVTLPLKAVGLLALIDLPQYMKGDHLALLRWHWSVRGPVYAVLVFMLLLHYSANEVPFIYFQF